MFRHLGDRKSEPLEIVDVLAARIGEVSAGDLPGAFEQVADERGPPELGPLVGAPAEAVSERSRRTATDRPRAR